MAKKQSRRSVSINRKLFTIATAQAESDGKTFSHWVSDLIIAARPAAAGIDVHHVSPNIVARIRKAKATNTAREMVRRAKRSANGARA